MSAPKAAVVKKKFDDLPLARTGSIGKEPNVPLRQRTKPPPPPPLTQHVTTTSYNLLDGLLATEKTPGKRFHE
jgi:hypothetical protein